MGGFQSRRFEGNMSKRVILAIVLLCAAISNAGKMYVVLLAGQSNMAGRGIIRIPEDNITYANVLSLNKDSIWVRAKNPVHWDKPEAGVGMGISFARELLVLLKSNDTLGLVPCAAGGTNIDNWLNNDHFASTGDFYIYKNLIARAKKASQRGPIIGMIWHQGESDATAARYSSYRNKLKRLFDTIRTDLKLPNMPIVAGELGRYLVNNSSYPRWDSINSLIHGLKKDLQHYDVASSIGLSSNSDITHFTTVSQDTLGIRYAKLFFALLDSSQSAILLNQIAPLKKSLMKVNRNSIQLLYDFPEAANVDIFDLSGKRVKSVINAKPESQIPIENLKGAFVVRISSGQMIAAQEIIAIP